MKSRGILRLIMAITILGLAWKGYKLAGDDPFLLLLLFLTVGAVGGLIVVQTLLPWLAEALGNSLYLPGGKNVDSEEENEAETPAGEDDAESEEAESKAASTPKD